MSTSKTYQQSLADVGSENRPPMLERGSYIPWASRFRRYLNRKRDNRKWLLKALDEGPYEFKNFILEGLTIPRLKTVEDLEGDDLLLHDTEMEVMNMILLSIPNEIYNSVDACTSAKDMWKRVERLMRGTIQNKVDRETRFTNEFDQFVAEPGEALVSVYNRFTQLMNDLERNNMNFPTVTINTKFLNSLQPEWLKYVTQVRLGKQLTVDSFDDLFEYLQQFEKLVNASRPKKLEKSHGPLALVANMGLSSRQTSSYYVTHPTSVVDYLNFFGLKQWLQLVLLKIDQNDDGDHICQVHEDSPSTSSIIIDTHEAPPVVTTSDEQTSPISLTEADEFNQEDTADFDGNAQFVPYNPPSHEEIESSTTALEPSNVHNLQSSDNLNSHLDKRSSSRPSYCTIKPKNIKEAMEDHSWIESMQDELNQFERLQVLELVPRPEGKSIIALKWL
ncbi:hypothetical protein Tco_0290405 [Tanacetum coccineum]